MQIIKNKPQVLIIGAGIGGIATAARLARRGFSVRVLEKNEIPGGRVGQMKHEGFTFDTGATLFLMPEVYAQTFTELGERMEEALDLQRIDPTYRLHFPDGSDLSLTSDMGEMRAQLEKIEPGSFARMQTYLAEGERLYDLSFENLLNREFRSLPEFINPRMLSLFLRMKALTRHTDYAGRFFKDQRLLMAFTFQDLYMGLSPYDSPATYSLMQSAELSKGVWYPKGGMYQVARGLAALAEKQGVEFIYDAHVARILIENEIAAGVLLEDGRELHADIVVANADLGYVYRKLLPDKALSRRLDQKEYGCSTIMFYWGLDRQYPEMGPHNLFLNGDYRQSFEAIFGKEGMPAKPNFYVHAPARMDPSVAPAGQDAWYVAVPVAHVDEFDNEREGETNHFWHAKQHEARAYILKRLAELGCGDVEAHIRSEVSFVPQWWQNRYNLTKGSTHGLSHKLTQMAYFRPHNRHNRYRNLYFVGASTHPGTGVPTVLLSAKLAVNRILEDTSI